MDLTYGYNIITAPASSDIEVKKSHFICEMKSVQSKEEADDFVNSIRKKHYDARHHCLAMRIGEPGNVFERSSDDGEPSGTAGKPMLDILKGRELFDVCAVVTRYFGGTLLGTGGLVRAYSDSLKEALELSGTAALERGYFASVVCSYQAAEKIKRAAFNMNIYVFAEEYTEKCFFKYLLKSDVLGRFEEIVRELSLGKAVFSTDGEALYYGGAKPVIYKLPGREARPAYD